MNEQDEEKMGVLEGILFVVGDEGINLESLAQIMNIKENNIVYGKEGLNIALKDIEDGEKLIEIETVETNEDLNTVEKLKEKLNELKLPLDTKDYFIKKYTRCYRKAMVFQEV